MHGFGSHTYSFINAKNERFWVKFHFKTQQGIKNLDECRGGRAVVGKDRESSPARPVRGHRARGFPESGDVQVQIMPERRPKRITSTRSISPRSGRTPTTR